MKKKRNDLSQEGFNGYGLLPSDYGANLLVKSGDIFQFDISSAEREKKYL